MIFTHTTIIICKLPVANRVIILSRFYIFIATILDNLNLKYKYDVIAEGVPDGNYTVNFAYNPAALEAFYPGMDILPEDAVTITPSSVYKDRSNHAYLEFELFPEKLGFFKTYYLPITITSASEYAGDAVLGNFFMTVEMKNEYEKTYSSTTPANHIISIDPSSGLVQPGDTVTVNAAAKGTTGKYQYAVMYKKLTSEKWTVAQKYGKNAEITLTPGTATDYEICVKAKDSNGAVAKKYFIISVKK